MKEKEKEKEREMKRDMKNDKNVSFGTTSSTSSSASSSASSSFSLISSPSSPSNSALPPLPLSSLEATSNVQDGLLQPYLYYNNTVQPHDNSGITTGVSKGIESGVERTIGSIGLNHNDIYIEPRNPLDSLHHNTLRNDVNRGVCHEILEEGKDENERSILPISTPVLNGLEALLFAATSTPR